MVMNTGAALRYCRWPRGAYPSYVPVRIAVRIPLHTLPRSE